MYRVPSQQYDFEEGGCFQHDGMCRVMCAGAMLQIYKLPEKITSRPRQSL
jgi:hypothetical protein